MDDRTDPLVPGGAPVEDARLLLLANSGLLEEVTLPGAHQPSAFLRLTITEPSLGQSLRPVLLALPEAATGFRDLLVHDTASLCAAFELPQHTLQDWQSSTTPRLGLRPRHLLQGLRDVAQTLHYLHTTTGLVWPEPEARWLGLHREPAAGNADALAEWRIRFYGWPLLATGTAQPAANALARLLLELWRGAQAECNVSAFSAGMESLNRWEQQLLALCETADLDYALLAAGLALPTPSVALYGHTDTGLKREHNEDAYLLFQLDQQSASGARLTLAAVADGMGGHASGEIAGSLALDLLRQQLTQLLLPPRIAPCQPGALPLELARLIPAIDSALTERARLEPSLAGMGTTLCGLAVLTAQSTLPERQTALSSASVIFWVGDSRAYLLGQGGLQRVSRDHSYVQDLLRAGEIQPAEAFGHPMKNVITRCLGGNGGEATPEIIEFTLGPGEVLLLCSDGLSDALRDEEIWDCACRAGAQGLPAMLAALIAAANAAGGPDNITVVAVVCIA